MRLNEIKPKNYKKYDFYIFYVFYYFTFHAAISYP